MIIELSKNTFEGDSNDKALDRLWYTIEDKYQLLMRGNEEGIIESSCDFQRNNAKEIDGVNLGYLLSGNKSPENCIPTVKYNSSEKNNFFPNGKHENMFSLLQEENFRPIFNKLFLEEYMIKETKIEMLESRKTIIYEAEINFVTEELEIDYFDW